MYSVLIADDEHLIREGLVRAIPWGDLGFDKVFSAANAYESISTVSSEHINLLLTDIMMPGKSGLELVDWIQQYSPETHTMIISGYDKFEFAQKALRLGVEDYILKPIKKNELIDKIKLIKERIDDEYKELETNSHYKKVFYLRKLLENSFLDKEELEEIKMRLEIPDLDNRHFCIVLVDCYRTDSDKAAYIFKDYINDDIGIYRVAIIPADAGNGVCNELESLGLPYSIGSEQSFDALSISFKKALEKLSHNTLEHKHSFNASFSDHKDMMKLLSLLADGLYSSVDSYLTAQFALFDNASSAKLWCLYFMDCLEQYFEKYKFTGVYQKAVKDSSSSDINELQRIFSQYLLKVYMTFEEKKKTSSEIIISNALKMIKENLGNKNFSLTNLADELKLSYGYLSSIFKQETGINFSEYITRERMLKAKEMLVDHKYKLYEIADSCGYSNYRYFSECFKKYWNSSPSEYQNNER